MKKERWHGFVLIAVALVVLSLLLVPALIQKFDRPTITSSVIVDASIPVEKENKCTIGLKYAPGKFSYTSRCSDESCSSRSLDCLLEIQNLDSSGGIFETVIFLTDENDKLIASNHLSSYISGEDYYEFKTTFSDTQGSDKCTYQVISVPNKKIC